MDKEKNIRNSCIRCGTCCLKGGPILHHEDKKILLDGHAGHQHLVTIRRGELALNPVSNKLEPVQRELIKVIGKGKDWSCYFYNERKSSCEIYEHRFLECRLLKCWDTSELISVIGKKTIVRTDIINPDDPIMNVIKIHEQECSCQEVEDLIYKMSKGRDRTKNLRRLNEIAKKDLEIRDYAIYELGMKKNFELFIFGRPITEILSIRNFPFSLDNSFRL